MFAFLQSRLRPDAFRQPDDFLAVLGERSGRWYNACLRITRDADLAADAVQDALLKAWGQRDKFRGDADLDTWIHRIALNAAIDLMRRRKPESDEEIDPDLQMASPQGSPDNQYANQALGKASLRKIADGPGDVSIRSEAVRRIGIVSGEPARAALREIYTGSTVPQIKDAALTGC